MEIELENNFVVDMDEEEDLWWDVGEVPLSVLGNLPEDFSVDSNGHLQFDVDWADDDYLTFFGTGSAPSACGSPTSQKP